MVEEFFSENKLPVVKSDIPSAKVVLLFNFLLQEVVAQFPVALLFRAADTALRITG